MATTSKLIVFNEVLRELRVNYPLVNLDDENPRLNELDGAYNHAVEFLLAKADWGFARRRSTLTGVSNSAFPPYTFSYTRPADWLRTCWIKTAATDEAEIDYAEVAATIYGFVDSALIEYISEDADNYDPVNWPPYFTRALVLYLAYLTAPVLARAGDEAQGKLWTQFQTAESDAEAFEARFLTNAAIPTNRLPVMRRALEMMSQTLGGSVPVLSQTAKLRWSMNQAWDHTVKYCLEVGAWNFASRRVRLTGGSEPIPGDTYADIIEGYTLPPATEPADSETLPPLSEYDYGFLLPADFLHKIWCKADANNMLECDHQFLRNAIYANFDTIILEYVSQDAAAIDPADWPATFLEVVASYLALTVAPELVIEEGSNRNRITATGARDAMERVYQSKLGDAKRKDAIQQMRKRMPPGSFVRARMGGASHHYKGGR